MATIIQNIIIINFNYYFYLFEIISAFLYFIIIKFMPIKWVLRKIMIILNWSSILLVICLDSEQNHEYKMVIICLTVCVPYKNFQDEQFAMEFVRSLYVYIITQLIHITYSAYTLLILCTGIYILYLFLFLYKNAICTCLFSFK